MIRRFAMVTLVLVAAACAHVRETSAPVAEGRRVFQAQGCYGCHTVGATGTAIGPDLLAHRRQARPILFDRLAARSVEPEADRTHAEAHADRFGGAGPRGVLGLSPVKARRSPLVTRRRKEC